MTLSSPYLLEAETPRDLKVLETSEAIVNMGANQSRPSDAAINEKLIERLQALHMKDERSTSEKDGFVVVGGEARRSLSIISARTKV